jgi:hypothetical protein
MKKVLCAVTLVLASTVVAVPTAHAGQHCVSRLEYLLVHRGMSKVRVHDIFDTSGHRSNGNRRYEVRSYRTCAPRSAVSVVYGRGRVRSKDAVWR